MSVVSKRQFKLMEDVVKGKRKIDGLTKDQAKELIEDIEYKKLPYRTGKSKSKMRHKQY